MELKELYQEIILDHAKNPRNKGKCEGYNHDAKAHNPLCGDKVHIYIKLEKDKPSIWVIFVTFATEFIPLNYYLEFQKFSPSHFDDDTTTHISVI